MAISYPLSLPARTARRVTFHARSTVGRSVSPFTGEQQVYVHQGEWWECEVELPPMEVDDAEEWVSFLVSLNGQEGTFLMGDPAGATPRGIATGTPLVSGGSQTGKTLATKGWTAGVTNILKAGDWLQLGTGSSSHLHKVVAAANSDGSGLASLEIWPRLRSSPAADAAIVVSAAKGLWSLAGNDNPWTIDLARIYGMSFTCREAL